MNFFGNFLILALTSLFFAIFCSEALKQKKNITDASPQAERVGATDEPVVERSSRELVEV